MYGSLAFQPSQYGSLHYGVAKTDVSVPGYPCIRQGATDKLSGGAVSLVQAKLWEVDAVPSGDDEFGTGVFGPQTDQNVRYFQQKSGLDADGIVGPLTAAKLGITDEWQKCSAVIESSPVSVDPQGEKKTVIDRINIFRLTKPGLFYGGIAMAGLILSAGTAIYLNERNR